MYKHVAVAAQNQSLKQPEMCGLRISLVIHGSDFRYLNYSVICCDVCRSAHPQFTFYP